MCVCVSDAVLGSARAEASGAVWGVAALGEDGVCRTTAGVWRDWRLEGLPKLQRTGPLYWRGQFLLLMMVTDIISYGYWLKEMQPSFTDFGRPGVSIACIWRTDMANSLLPVFFFPLPVFDPIRSCRSRPTSTLLWQYLWWSIGHSVGSLWSGPMWSRASWITPRLSSGGSQRRTTKSQSQNQTVRAMKEVMKIVLKVVPSTKWMELFVMNAFLATSRQVIYCRCVFWTLSWAIC